LWLEGDLFSLSTHTVSEKLRDDRLKLSLEIYDEFRDKLERAYLVISIDSPVNMDYRFCRWRISLNKFNISRVLKPFKEVVYESRRFLLLLYDLTPIKNMLDATNELYIEYKGDQPSNLDFVGLLSTYSVSGGGNKPGVFLFEEPIILEYGKKITINAPGDISRDRSIHMVMKALTPGTETVIKNDSRVLNGVEEYMTTIPSGENSFSIEVVRGVVYIPLIIAKERRFKDPNYSIRDVKVSEKSDKSPLLRIYLDNHGDLDVSEILVVALQRGRIIANKRISGVSREVELEIDKRLIDSNDPRIYLRVIWNWLGSRYFSSKEAVIRV